MCFSALFSTNLEVELAKKIGEKIYFKYCFCNASKRVFLSNKTGDGVDEEHQSIKSAQQNDIDKIKENVTSNPDRILHPEKFEEKVKPYKNRVEFCNYFCLILDFRGDCL